MTDRIAQSPAARTWREIPQDLKLPAMSSKGRRRVIASSVKATIAIVLVGLLAVGGVALYQSRLVDPSKTPLRAIALRTDGVLDKSWVENTLGIPAGTALAALDLDRLRDRLLSTGRIESARLSRSFPSTLSISLFERFPVAKIRVEDRGDYFVGRDGVVFGSAGERDAGAFDGIPWLGGFHLALGEGGFSPIAGMPAVAALLATARNEAPGIYRTWASVDLSRLGSDGEIDVQTKDGPRVRFGTASDYFIQIARLDYVLDHSPAAASIDLTIGDNAVLVLDSQPPAHSATQRPAQRFNLRL